jgi:hypothetical protein
MRTFSLIMFVIAGVGMVLHCRFLWIMRFRHPGLWQSLGKPGWYSAFNSLTRPRVLRFLWYRDYQVVPDREFATLGVVVRFYYLIFICVFVVFVIALALSARPTI